MSTSWLSHCAWFGLWLAWLVAAHAANVANPQSAEGDLVLPMPHGLQMVFRPVFLGEGEKPFALKKFEMGDPTSDFKENLTTVVLGGAFKSLNRGRMDWFYYIGKYEVTDAQYSAVMALPDTPVRDSQYPVGDISWFDAQAFINKYNLWLLQHAKEALPKHKAAKDESLGYVRLPTEVEWEFAARGGIEVDEEKFKAKFPYTEILEKHEWFGGETSSHGKVKKVGLLAPNALHIYDMLGNVSEMTMSMYQIEYYQGRVGGFVARGGNYLTPRRLIRASLRNEQPFYGRDSAPHKSPELGMRLVIASVIFTDLPTAKELSAAWQDYRQGGTGATAPAAVSIAPPSTQANVQLADAVKIVESLLNAPTLAVTQQRDLEILRASFGNIKATIKKAEVDDAYAWILNTRRRTTFVYRTLKAIPKIEGTIKIAVASNMQSRADALRKSLADAIAEMDDDLNEYIATIKRLDAIEVDSRQSAFEKYMEEIASSPDVQNTKKLLDVVRKHIAQYTQEKRANREQWKADLGNIQ